MDDTKEKENIMTTSTEGQSESGCMQCETEGDFGRFTRVKSLPGTPVRKQLSAQAEQSHVVVERIYCVRQVLHKVNEEYYAYGGVDEMRFVRKDRPQVTSFKSCQPEDLPLTECANPVVLGKYSSSPQEHHHTTDQTELDLPQRLMRRRSNRAKGSMRRSRSQPMHSPTSDEDNIRGNGFTIAISSVDEGCSGAGDSGIISGTSGEENCDGGSEEIGGCRRTPRENTTSISLRSSLYSTGSSITTSSRSSTGSTDTAQERISWEGDSVILAEALWDHVSMQPEELQFAVGDVIQVYDWSLADLWFGTCKKRSGWFPASYVRLLANQNVDDQTSAGDSEMNENENQNDANYNRQKLLRRSVLQELVSTERDYFSLLKNLIEGFLYQARRRKELFPAEILLVIFGNLEQIYELHKQFLTDLEQSIEVTDPDSSCVGHCFLKHVGAFEIYSDYCNNHPLSCTELGKLYRQASYRQFFEACRLLRGMPELSLDAFLLTPVQRICKYPLQLGELVKSTSPNHPDSTPCREALVAMRRVAAIINDRKRRLEQLQKIAIWQRSVEGWQGPELVEESCALIFNGEVTCRCMRKGALIWTREVSAFLFDRTLVLCKKDILKRNQLIFKDRVSLKHAKWSCVVDGKDSLFGVSVKHGWKVSVPGDYVYLFTSKSRQGKLEWISAFQKQESAIRDRPKIT